MPFLRWYDETIRILYNHYPRSTLKAMYTCFWINITAMVLSGLTIIAGLCFALWCLLAGTNPPILHSIMVWTLISGATCVISSWLNHLATGFLNYATWLNGIGHMYENTGSQ